MSLSQKHSGKVLVPWFNIAEWKAVYDLIYTEEKQNWPKALKVLKIWKLRTPLLSAGVEGTLILLEALLIDAHKLSSYESIHIFSTSLVRFLNLCAASSEKQGTFYKAAMKSGLPKWLVGIRHDIAHSHHVPSQSMLDLSLRFCLSWLKERYWDVQYKCMSDLVVSKSDDRLLEDVLYIHVQLAQSGVLESNIKEMIASINGFAKSHDHHKFTSRQLVEHLNTTLKDVIQSNKHEAAHKIGALLIDSCVILQTDTETNNLGTKKIPTFFRNKWNNLLDIIYETEVMPHFIYKLFDFLCDETHDQLHREIASLWIQEIFTALLNENKNDLDVMHFTSKNKLTMDKKFVREVLEKPTPFTLTFLRQILEYNNAPIEFIKDCVNLISALYTYKSHDSDNISTVRDLNLELPEHSPVHELHDQSNFRWILIKDTVPYRNLPLGILPQQSGHLNPLLDL